MESFSINDVNIVPYEDKCGLKDDGTYLICYSGWRAHCCGFIWHTNSGSNDDIRCQSKKNLEASE